MFKNCKTSKKKCIFKIQKSSPTIASTLNESECHRAMAFAHLSSHRGRQMHVSSLLLHICDDFIGGLIAFISHRKLNIGSFSGTNPKEEPASSATGIRITERRECVWVGNAIQRSEHKHTHTQ